MGKGKIIKTEESARNERYLFFKSCAKKYKISYVCTAHHLNDQAETILFRIARGTGPNGIMPIKQFLVSGKNLIFYRPLLNILKEEIVNYARKNNISYIDDKTNLDKKYKRNLIRHDIIPVLKQINKDSLKNVLLFSDLVYSQSRILDAYFISLLKKISLKSNLRWYRNKFLGLNHHLQKVFIYWFMSDRGIKGNLNKLDFILQKIKSKEKIDLDKKYILNVTERFIVFEVRKEKKIKNPASGDAFKFLVNGRSKKFLLTGSGIFLMKQYTGKDFKWKFPRDHEKKALVNLSGFKNKFLVIRHRKPSDVFYPLGFSSQVKFKKYLINKKIPSSLRYTLPMICYHNEVLWLPGYSLSEKIKVTDKPTHIFELKTE